MCVLRDLVTSGRRCGTRVPRKLVRPGSSLRSPLWSCSCTQWSAASPPPKKCVPQQKLLTWLKLACPVFRLLPHHTRTGPGTASPYALRRSMDHRRRRPLAGGCGERSRRNEFGLVGAGARFRVTLLNRVGGAQFFSRKCSPTRDN